MIWCILLIIAGVLAAASLIVQKQPNAKELIDKLVPYQGIIGVIVCLAGIWDLIQFLLHLSILRHVPMMMLAVLGVSLTMILLGFILGYGLINQYVLSRNAQFAEQGVTVQRKLIAIQVPLGLAGIAFGIWGLAMTIMYR